MSNSNSAVRLLAGAIKKAMHGVRRLYLNLPIAGKLVTVLNVIILIPLITINYISYKNTEEALKTKSIQYSQDILQMIDLRLNDSTNNLADISEDLLSDERIYRTIDSFESQGKLLYDYENELKIGSILKNTIATRDGVQSICIMTENGTGFFANNNKVRENIRTILHDNVTLYDEISTMAAKAGGTPVWYLESANGTVQHIFLARTMYNHDTYKKNGMIIILVSPDYLSTAFEGLVSKDVQNVELVSPNSALVLQKAPQAHEDHSVYERMQSSGWLVDEETKSLISYKTIDKLGWKVVSYVSLSRLYSDVYEIRRKIIVSCIFAVIFMSAIGLFMSVDFVSSISKLVNGMEKLQRGEEDIVIELDRKDEIGFMGDAFNKMVKEISVLEKWVYHEQLTRKEAEIKALQSQINPHFLFNTLETINWMAILGNVPEISKTITALSSLMEASIMRGSGFIPLSEELNYINNFIFILTKRFEDRLEVVTRVDPAALEVTIPKLLIQPLVENAVYHGVENSRSKGVVTIEAKVIDNYLFITVEDNGTGIDEQELAAINARLSMDDNTYFEDTDKRKKRKGIGLDNVNRRIKLCYGPEYGLKIEGVKGQFTRVLVKIPLAVKERLAAASQETINS